MKKQESEGVRTYSTVSSREKGTGPGSAGQSGDTQGLSDVAEAGSESVEELVEEGQAFEADVISGVESAPDADVAEEGAHAVIVRLAPPVEGVVVALGAGDANAQEHLRQRARHRPRLARRLEEVIHDRDDHVLILDLGPADKVNPRVESLGKTFESVRRTAVVI